MNEFNIGLSAGGLALCVALAILFGWLGARPLNLAKGPRLAPYRLLMLLSGAGAVGVATHLVMALKAG
jgi:hypothetical protein